ncbi:MAG: sigma-70 family RNA polymerase sigma factor [Phycisphaerales bacterium]|nr:sigma-70 family RNA polymerase sigma factor [Phycisphaerales bacterium]
MNESSSASAAAATDGAHARTAGPVAIQAREFWQRFESARQKLWLVAAGVMGQAADADDVVQEASLVGVAKFGEFAPGTNFEAWMAQITRLTALNMLRRRDRHRGSGEPDLQSLNLVRTAHGAPAAQELSPNVRRELESLDETARLCVLLRIVGEMPYAKISAILQIPEGTAMSHVHRATRSLRAVASHADKNSLGGHNT